jgi:manganese oxidase
MDGMPGISQDAIAPGKSFTYEFTLHQNGTFFYHSHMAMQEMMGVIGLFIIHPRRAHTPRVDRDFGIVLQEWAILPNNTVPNSLAMEFNWLTLNGKSGPATTPLLVRLGERVRIRVVNLGMDHHPMHPHGHQFYATRHGGGSDPQHG